MLSTTREHCIKPIKALVLLFGISLSLIALVTPTSSHSVEARFEIRQGFPLAGTGDPDRPLIKVTAKKNKQVYDTVEVMEGGLRYLINARGQCGSEGSKDNLHTATVKLYTGTKLVGSDTFPVDRSHRSLGAEHGQGWNYYTLVFPYSHPRTNPVEACNKELEQRERSRVQLLQQGFNVELTHAYDAELNLICMEDQGAGFQDVPSLPHKARTPLSAKVRCMPTGYVPTTGAPPKHGVHLDPLITDVALKSEPAEMKGHACPVYVGFRGQITAGENRPGEDLVKIKYRFVGDRGFTTPFYEETLRKAETKPVFWKRRIEALPVAGGPNKMLAPGVKPKIPIYQGWTTLEVVYPGTPGPGRKSSQRATFTVDCNPVPQRTPPPRGPRVKPNG